MKEISDCELIVGKIYRDPVYFCKLEYLGHDGPAVIFKHISGVNHYSACSNGIIGFLCVRNFRRRKYYTKDNPIKFGRNK